MTILIRQAHIIDPASPFHSTQQDVLIENGSIKQIGQLQNSSADKIIEHENLKLTQGWEDMFVKFFDPGY